jgi:ubiquinone/menaquinone biosynthesis C-methylase UbiE
LEKIIKIMNNTELDTALNQWFPISAHDLSTRDKIPILKRMMEPIFEGPVLDIGIGTGYLTYRVFGDRPLVCLDLHEPNLRNLMEKIACFSPSLQPMCVVARATQLPFKPGVFKNILCSEVLEHLEDDQAAVNEIARVLSAQGHAVISVPYDGYGFAGFIEAIGIKTVHDFPGPEQHFRRGYDENSLRTMFEKSGLIIRESAFYFRFFTRFLADFISLINLLYQRIKYKRKSWTWSEISEIEGSAAFSVYKSFFRVLWAFSRLDRILQRLRGFGIIVAVAHGRGKASAINLKSSQVSELS